MALPCDLRFASAFLRDQERGQSAGVFVTHGAVGFESAGTQSLRIFHPLKDPSRGEAGTNLRQRRTDVSFVSFAVDDVAALTGVFAIKKLLAQLNLALRVAARAAWSRDRLPGSGIRSGCSR